MRTRGVLYCALLASGVLALPDHVFPRQTATGNISLTGSPTTTIFPTSTATSSGPLTCIQGKCLQTCGMLCDGVGLASWWTGTYTVTAATRYETWSMKNGQLTLLNSSNVVNASVSAFLKSALTDWDSYTLPGVPTTLIGDGVGGYPRVSVLVLGSTITAVETAGSSTVYSTVLTSPQQWTEGCGFMTMGVELASQGTTDTGSGVIYFANKTGVLAIETGPASDLDGAGELFVTMGQQYLSGIADSYPTIPLDDLDFPQFDINTWPGFPLSLCSGEIDGIPNPHIPVSALTITSAVTLAAVSVPSTPAELTTSANDQTTSKVSSTVQQSATSSGTPVSAAGSTVGQSSTLNTGNGGSSSANNPPSQEPGTPTTQIQTTEGGQGGNSVAATNSGQAGTPSDAGQIFSSILDNPTTEPDNAPPTTTAGNAPTTGIGTGQHTSPLPSTGENAPTTGVGPESSSGGGSVNPPVGVTVISSASAITLEGQTLTAGGSAATISGTMFSLGPSGTAIVINGNTTPLSAVPIPNTALSGGGSANPAGGDTVVNSASAITLGGQIIAAGGSAATISGTVFSLVPSGTAVVINGNTTPLTAIPISAAGTESPIAVITPLTAAGGSTGIVVGSSTLLPGSEITVSGTTYSLPSSGAGVVVDGTTTQLPSAVTVAGTTGVAIGGQTLLPGSEITVGGTTLSLAPSGGGVVVVPGTTSGGGLGGAIMSGLGQTGQGSNGPTTATGSTPPAFTGGAVPLPATSIRGLVCCIIVVALVTW